jgi:hypothetical protein
MDIGHVLSVIFKHVLAVWNTVWLPTIKKNLFQPTHKKIVEKMRDKGLSGSPLACPTYSKL